MFRQGLFLALLTTSLITHAEPAGTVIAIKKENPENAEQVGGTVARSALTSQVQDREPLDKLDRVTDQQGQLVYFTELRGMSGQTAKHRWQHNGKVMAEVEFDIKGPRWRVWSSKNFIPDWTGEWTISVINGAGEVISEQGFTYEATKPAVAE